jgi:hypothetical protein
MHHRRNQQRGVSLPTMLFWVVLAAFFATILVKLTPIYVSNWTVRSVMEEVAHAKDGLDDGKKGIREQLRRRLEVNDVTTVGANDFSVEEAPDGTYDLVVDYEVRVHLFFNIDAVVSFHHEVPVTGR